MRVMIICLLFAVGIFCSSGNAETDVGSSGVRQPACERYRSPACPKILDPVCGTDQQTYPNECMLCAQNQRNNVNIQIQKKGNCWEP